MELNKITAEVNMESLQAKANEFAQKGAEKEVEDFYSGYDSPYRKAIKENLRNKGVDAQFDIPDIIAVLNDKFQKEVDQIANTAVAKSFLPLVKEFLSREDAEIKFSDILRKFIETTDFKNSDELRTYDYTVEKCEPRHSSSSLNETFFDYAISNGKIKYEIHFYKQETDLINIMSLPYLIDESGHKNRRYESSQTMKISLDGGASLELPFTKGILEDPFISYMARLVIGNNNIIFDTTEFDEDMFPNDHCHC